MPTSKHRKKHKIKFQQRKNTLLQSKNAQNRKMAKFQEQIDALIQQQKDFVASGGKAEDFNPQLVNSDNNSANIEEAVIIEEEKLESNSEI